jgi:cytochrome c oxidase subunit II
VGDSVVARLGKPVGRPEVERVKLGRALAPVFMLALMTILLAGCTAPSIFRADSTQAKDIRTLALIVFAIMGVVLLVVWVWLALAIIRYRRNPESQARQTHGNMRVEAIWTLIPAVIVGVLFYLTLHTTGLLVNNVQGGGVDMKVTSHQWWWGVDYPSGKFTTANEIHVPVDRTASTVLIAADVIHSFWVPQMGGKLDMIPGHVNTLHFLPTKIGRYIGECSEYCGHQHGRMRFLLVVESVADFDAWFANQRRPEQAPVGAQATAGAKVIGQQPCAGCHNIRGNDPMRGITGPDLTHVSSRSTLAALTIANTPPNMRRWIKDPQAVKPGNLMPTVPLTAEQLDQITAYLEGLK